MERRISIYPADVDLYLTHLVRNRRASASMQNQPMSAIVFLYACVLADERRPDHLGLNATERSRPGRETHAARRDGSK